MGSGNQTLLALLNANVADPSARRLLDSGIAQAALSTIGEPVSAAVIQTTYRVRAAIAGGAAGPGVGRRGTWDEFMPALCAAPFDCLRLQLAKFQDGRTALIVTDDTATKYVAGLLLEPK